MFREFHSLANVDENGVFMIKAAVGPIILLLLCVYLGDLRDLLSDACRLGVLRSLCVVGRRWAVREWWEW